MKVAVLGLGSAGSRHARDALSLGHEVIGFDPMGKQFEGGDVADSAEAAIEAGDAVVVASPNSFHAEHALAALERRRPVLVEKPLSTSTEDAEAIVAAAERAGNVAAVGMNLRFHPGVVELKRLIENGALGDIRLVRASFGYDLRLWRPHDDYRRSYSARSELGGGIVLDAIHELDYLLWLLGPVASVAAEAGHVSELEVDVEDAAVASLRFRSGALGALDLNFFEPAYRRGCVLVGTGSVASWDWVSGSVTVSREGAADLIVEAQADPAETHRAVTANFLAAVEGSEQPRTTVREGLEAVKLAAAIKLAATTGTRTAP